MSPTNRFPHSNRMRLHFNFTIQTHTPRRTTSQHSNPLLPMRKPTTANAACPGLRTIQRRTHPTTPIKPKTKSIKNDVANLAPVRMPSSMKALPFLAKLCHLALPSLHFPTTKTHTTSKVCFVAEQQRTSPTTEPRHVKPKKTDARRCATHARRSDSS